MVCCGNSPRYVVEMYIIAGTSVFKTPVLAVATNVESINIAQTLLEGHIYTETSNKATTAIHQNARQYFQLRTTKEVSRPRDHAQ